VLDPSWRGNGPGFSLSLRSVSLSLDLEKPNSGLELREPYAGAHLLALDGLARAGRSDSLAFGARSLVGWDLIHGRLVATYAAAGWEGLTVRASWRPTPGRDGIDLEIQASADSAARLERVEVGVLSQWLRADCGFLPALVSRVESRDAQAAVQSYDGREPAAVLSRLTTLPLPASWATALKPLVVTIPGTSRSFHYVEMVQPDDVARRIIGTPADDRTMSQLVLSVRYGLLGHDIERGIVLRARLRGLWIESERPQDDVPALWRQFLDEPLPLGP